MTMPNAREKSTHLPALLLLAGLVIAVFIPIMLRMLTSYDFMVHNGLVEKMWRTGTLQVYHPLYHLVTLAWSLLLFPDNTSYAGIATILLAKVCSAGIMYTLLVRGGASKVTAMAAALGGVFATHIIAAYPFDHKILGGYINPNVLHNPTIITLAPIALAQFWLAGKILKGDDSGRVQVLAIITTILSVSAKPSYLMAFLPALVLMAVILKFQGKTIAMKSLIFIIIFWAAASVPQYLFTYGPNQQQELYSGISTIAWLPLKVMSNASGYLLLKLLASVAFPLICAVLFPRSLRDTAVIFAWITFLVSLVYAYFLAEQGPRISHGNFVWSAQISLYVLMFASMRNLLTAGCGGAAPSVLPKLRYALCLTVFSLHVVSAIAYYSFEYLRPEMYW